MRIRLRALSDDELIASLRALVGEERRTLFTILCHLQEMDDRRLAPRRAFPSLFDFCVKDLRWAEGETAKRIQVARKAMSFPLLLRAIRRGGLSLSGAALLAPHLSRENYSGLVRSAYWRPTRDVEALVAALAPKPEPRERARFLGIAGVCAPPDAEASAPASETLPIASAGPAGCGAAPALPAPQAPQRVHFSFTSDERLLADVERAKDLLRSKYRDPDFEAVFGEGVRTMLELIDPDRRKVKERAPAQALPGDARSRTAPAWVKRAVWRRDGGHCSFRGEGGRLCRSTAGLQYDHIIPWALGGRSDDPANIRLLCRTHNRLEARRSFGDELMDRAAAGGLPRPDGPEEVPARAASQGEEGPAPGKGALSR